MNPKDLVEAAIEETKPKKKEPSKVPSGVLDFYVNEKRYREVYVVTCLECGSDLCLFVLDPAEVAKEKRRGSHPRGLKRIEFTGGTLMGHRIRADGELGFQCSCGNFSQLNEAEKGVVPQGSSEAILGSSMPHHKALVEKVAEQIGYTPDVEEKDGVRRIDQFEIRKVR